MTDSACLRHVRKFWAKVLEDKGQGVTADWTFRDMVIEEARPGHLLCRLPISHYHLNGLGSVQGGIVMSLIDICTWLSLQTEGGPEVPSVSANMSCEYVRPAGAVGDTLWIKGTVVNRGRKLAFCRVEFRLNDPSSPLVAFGSHTQVIFRPPRLKYLFGEDGEVKPLPEEEKAKL